MWNTSSQKGTIGVNEIQSHPHYVPDAQTSSGQRISKAFVELDDIVKSLQKSVAALACRLEPVRTAKPPVAQDLPTKIHPEFGCPMHETLTDIRYDLASILRAVEAIHDSLEI